MAGSRDVARGGWVRRVLTDVQFWVPLTALIGGLLLLRAMHSP